MSLEKQKIIIVEDDPDHAELIVDALEEEEVEMEIVLLKDGKEAMDYFQNGSINCNGDDVVQSQIGLVILDLNLPKVSGMDILKFLKSNSKYSSMNVIILSTSSNYETIAEAYKNGANGYFTKPISYEDFVEKVKLLKGYWLDTDKLPVCKRTYKGRILIADDEETFLQSTADLLRREGYDCDCVRDAMSVMERLRSDRYDLLISDINMTGNTELELIKDIQGIVEGMPIILATGNPILHSEIQSIKHPVLAYMFKPFEVDKLLAQVRLSIENYRGGVGNR